MPRPNGGEDEGRVREERGAREGQGFVENYVLREGQGFRELTVTTREHPGTGIRGGPAPSSQQMFQAVLFGHLPPGVRRTDPGSSGRGGASR